MRPLAAKINSQTRLLKGRHRLSLLVLPVLMSGLLKRRWVQIWFKTTETPSTINNQGLTQTTKSWQLLTIVAPTFRPWGMPNSSNYSWKTLLPQLKWPMEQSVVDRLIAVHWEVSTSMPRNHRRRIRTSLKTERDARDSPSLTWPTVKTNSLALSFAARTSHSRKVTSTNSSSHHRLSI